MSLEPDDPRHGTFNGYCNQRCRCPDCRQANYEYRLEWNRQRLTAEDTVRHGERATYGYGCRCPACTEAARVDQADYFRRRRDAA